MGKTTILGVDFDTYTLDEAAEHAVNLMNESGQHIVCTPNPEIVMEAQHDRELMGILKAARRTRRLFCWRGLMKFTAVFSAR